MLQALPGGALGETKTSDEDELVAVIEQRMQAGELEDAGEVLLGGRRLRVRSPAGAIRHGITRALMEYDETLRKLESTIAGLDSLNVQFTATVAGADTTGLFYQWDFDNDGTFDQQGATLQVVTHAYGPGLWSVRLRVTNTGSEEAIKAFSSLENATEGGYVELEQITQEG